MADTSVHNEILYWDFQNDDFEKKAAQTLTTLQKLEKALNINTIVDIAKGFQIGSLAKDVDTVAASFTNLGKVATRILTNITDDAYRTGKKFISSLTIDDAKMGWGKYEEQIGAVQTLMNTTGLTSKEIQKYVDKFAIFSDETSYSLDQMVKAFSQMTTVADLSGTAADKAKELKKIQDMIIGIANASAFAGKTGQEFQRTIYNLTQSYQTGHLQQIDWKSLQMAGTASKQLMEEMIKEGENLYKQTKGKNGFKEGTVTVQNFSSMLKKGVIDMDVMKEAFGNFGELSVAAVEAVMEGKYDTFSQAIEDLAGNFSELAERAARSSYEAKTFTEAINAMHDAVSTKWSQTYQIIVGDYEEATLLWTNVANTLWELFAAGGEKRNEVLREWAKEDGRFFLIVSLQNILNAILDFVHPIKEAWAEVFSPITGHQLALLTKKLQNFTLDLRLTGETQAKIKSIALDFANAIKTVIDVLKEATRPILDFIGPLDQLGNKILVGVKIISLLANGLAKMALQSEVAMTTIRILLGALAFKKFLPTGIKLMFTLISAIKLFGVVAAVAFGVKSFIKFRDWISSGKAEESLAKVTGAFDKFKNALSGFKDSLMNMTFEKFLNGLKNIGSFIKSGAVNAFGTISNYLGTIDWRGILPEGVVNLFDGIIAKFSKLKTVIDILKGAFQRGGISIKDWSALVEAGFGDFSKRSMKVVYALNKIISGLRKFKSFAGEAVLSIKNLFTKDILSGKSPIEDFITTLKNGFTSKEGFMNLLSTAKNSFISLFKVAGLGWKTPIDKVKEINGHLKGLPSVIFTISSKFRGLFDSLKNPETIKSFGRSITDIFTSVGGKAFKSLDSITNGKYHDGLTKLANAFSKIKSIVGSITSKGLEGFYFILQRLYSLIGPSSYLLMQGIGRIGSALGTLDVKIGALGPKILSVVGNIKNNLPGLLSPIFKVFDTLAGGRYTKIIDLAKSVFADLGKTVSSVGGAGFKRFTDSIKTLFDTFASGAPLTKTLGKLKDSIVSFFGIFKGSGTKMTTSVAAIGGETNVVLKTLSDFKDRLDYIVDGISRVAHKINDMIPPELGSNIIKLLAVIGQLIILRKVGKSIRGAFTEIGTTVKTAGEGFKTIFTPFKALADGIPAIFKPFEALAEGTAKLATTLDTSLTSLTGVLRKKWKAETFEYRANGIFKIASAVALLASAIWIVAQIPIENNELWKATAAIAGLMVALLAFATVYDKLGQSWLVEAPKIDMMFSKLAGSIFYFGKSTMIVSLALSMITMASAIKMLMEPMKELSNMTFDEWWSGFYKLAAMMVLVGGSVTGLGIAVKGAGPGILAATLLLWAFNGILKKFAETMLIFGELFTGDNWKKMAVGAASVASIIVVTMGTIAGVAFALSKFTSNAKILGGKVNPAGKALLATGVLLAGIVFFLNQMADIVAKFRDLKIRASEILIALEAVAGILVAISIYAGILKVTKLEDGIKNAGRLMIGFAGALALVAVALHLFSALDMEKIGNALPAIVIAITSMLGVIWALGHMGSGMTLGSGLGILGFAAVITSLTFSLMLLTLLDYAKLESASGSLSKVLLALGVCLGLASKFSGKATTMIAFTFVIKELTGALLILSFMDYAKLESSVNNLSKVLLAAGVMMLFSGGMATTGVLQWIGAIGLILTLVWSLMTLQDIDTTKLKNTATIVGALEVVSGIMIAVTGLLPPGSGLNSLAALFGASLVIGAIGGLLYAVSQLPNPELAINVLNSCIGFFITVGLVIGVLGKLQPNAGIIAALNLLEFAVILGLVLVAFGEFINFHNDVTDRMMEDMHTAFTEIGKFIGDIAGGFTAALVDKAGDSLEKIKGFIESVKELKDVISPDEATGISTGLGVVKDLLTLEIPNDGGLAGLIFGNNNIGDFGNDIRTFGLGLKAFTDSITGITATDEEIQGAIRAAEGIAALAEKIPESGGLIQAAAGAKDLGEFAMQIAGGSFGGGMSVMHGDFGGSGRSLSNAIAGATSVQRGLGGAIKLFTDSVKDIPDDAYKSADKAIKAVESIADFAHRVPESGGYLQKITGVHDMAQFAHSLAGDGPDGSPGFVTAVTTFVEEMSKLGDPKDAVTKLQATQPLIDFFKNNTSVWDAMTTSMMNIENAGNPLVTACRVVKEYATELETLQEISLDPSTIGTIMGSIMATEPILNFFKDNTGLFDSVGEWARNKLGVNNPLASAIQAMDEYADKLGLLSQYSYLDSSTLTHIGEVLSSSTEILKFYEDSTGPIKSAIEWAKKLFDKGNNPLVDAIEALIPYAQALVIYSTKISGIGDMNKIIRSTVAFGNFADAIQTLFSSHYADLGDGFAYIGDFSSRLGTIADAMVELDNKFGDKDFSKATDGIKLIIETLDGMKGIGPLSADGFVTSVNQLAESGIDEFCEKFSNSEDQFNRAVSDFLTTIVSVLSRSTNADRLKTGAINLFKGYLEGQKKSLDEAQKELETFIKELPNSLSVNETVMRNIGIKITSGIAEGIQLGKPAAIKSAKAATHEIMTAVGEGVGDAYDDPVKGDESKYGILSGLKIDAGLGKGMLDGLNYIKDGVTGVGTAFMNTFNSWFGEGGTATTQANEAVGGMWTNIKNSLTGNLEGIMGVKFEDIFKDIYVADGPLETFVNFVKGWAEKFTNVVDETADESEKIAKEGANNVGKATSGAAAKAVKDAEEAGKEILTNEDAFWVALLAKKRAGADASEYQDMKVKDFEKKMLEEVNKLVDDYKEKLNSTTDDILGMIGLFDKVEDKVEETEDTFGDLFKGIGDKATKLEGNIEDLFRRVDTVTKSDRIPVSGDELMANLQDQIDKYTEYYDIQDNLAKRINNNKLKKTLREMTIDSIEELKALNDMSDKELNEYVELFEERIKVASRGQAKKDTEESPTADILTKNLEDQVEKYRDYKEVITNLNARVTSKKLKETLNNMGIDNMEELKVIESMTDEELTHYTALFEEKYSLSKDTAEVKLEETKQVTEDKLNELLETTGLQLDTFLEMFDGTLSSLTDLIEKHLSGTDIAGKVGNIAQALVEVLLGIFNNAELSAEQKVASIGKSLEFAAKLGIDITDQYSQGIQAILNNTELTTEQKLNEILNIMMKSQVSLAQSSQNLAQTTKDTISKILSNAEASKLVKSLLDTLQDGVTSAESKIEKFKETIRIAGEGNVQLAELYRTQINQLLEDTTHNADYQINALLEILRQASSEYQNWAIQDLNLLSSDLVGMGQISQSGVSGIAGKIHNILKDRLLQTTEMSEDQVEELTKNVTSELENMSSSALSSEEAFGSAVQGIVQTYCDGSTTIVREATNSISSLYSTIKEAQAAASASIRSSGGSGGSSKSEKSAFDRYEENSGKTLTGWMKDFAMSGGAIYGGANNVIKDNKYWDGANHMAYDLASGVGEYTGAGFADGVARSEKSMQNAAVHAANSVTSAVEKAFGINSPSKVFMDIARFVILGWVDGIDKYSNLMDTSAIETTDSYIDIFNESMRNLDTSFDMNPVITPVVDMTRVEDSMRALDSLFNTDKSYSMASDIKRAADIAARAKVEAKEPVKQTEPQQTTMNFTQNNYSPKALSKLDIYRQTKNQFAQMKGALA